VRDAHKRVDPRLTAVDGSSEHSVACLLDSSARSRIWDGIQSGRDQESLQRIAAASTQPEVPESERDQPESEGTDIEGSEERVVESEHPEDHGGTPQPFDPDLQRTSRGDIPPPEAL
jgi:hypothetical protein